MTGLQEAGARARAPPLPSAAAIGNVLPLTLRSNSRRRPVRLCPSPDSGLWGGLSPGLRRRASTTRPTSSDQREECRSRCDSTPASSALMMRPLMALRASYSSIARSRSSRLGGQALRVRDRLFSAAIPCATQTTRVIETGVRGSRHCAPCGGTQKPF